MEPKNYIKTFYEPRQGFKYEQPIEKLNGKSYFEYPENSFERENWGFFKKESYNYNSSLDACKFESELWTNKDSKINAFNKIYDFIKKGKSGSGSSITPLFPFEIYLMNDGFEMVSFCELNAINPGISIVADSQNGDVIANPKGIKYGRCYLKNDNFIHIAFGISFGGIKTNFYFQTSKSNHYFQVDNSFDNYEKAINGQLPYLDKKNDL